MKFTWKGYWQPTPKSVRKLADSILVGATFISTYNYVNDNPKLATIVMVVSVIAKIISNFLTDETETNNGN
jgi:hypothetical protein